MCVIFEKGKKRKSDAWCVSLISCFVSRLKLGLDAMMRALGLGNKVILYSQPDGYEAVGNHFSRTGKVEINGFCKSIVSDKTCYSEVDA
jgi:hypothetical protein